MKLDTDLCKVKQYVIDRVSGEKLRQRVLKESKG